jgi:hypothetical protein
MDIFLEITKGLEVNIRFLQWRAVQEIIKKHINAARKELLEMAESHLKKEGVI